MDRDGIVSLQELYQYLEHLQARTLDLLRLQDKRVASNVVIVAIDQDAFESLGRWQPISREYLARLVRAL